MQHLPPELKGYNTRTKICSALYCIGIHEHGNKFVKVGMSINLINRLRNYKTILTRGFYILALIIFNEEDFSLVKTKETTKARIKWVLQKEKELQGMLKDHWDREADEWTGAKESYLGSAMPQILECFKTMAERYSDNVEKVYLKPFRSHIKPVKDADGILIREKENVKRELDLSHVDIDKKPVNMKRIDRIINKAPDEEAGKTRVMPKRSANKYELYRLREAQEKYDSGFVKRGGGKMSEILIL